MSTAADNPAGRHGRLEGRVAVGLSAARSESSTVLQGGSR